MDSFEKAAFKVLSEFVDRMPSGASGRLAVDVTEDYDPYARRAVIEVEEDKVRLFYEKKNDEGEWR